MQTGTTYILALCHDLIEDTDISWDEISEAAGIPKETVADVLTLLSKPKGMSYIEYINNLRESGSSLAYCIKLADMKDHLMEKDTLTDRLKEKYWNALPYLL